MGYPDECDTCIRDRVNPHEFKGHLKLDVKPFNKGINPQVMLVGLNPTLARGKADYVFELDNEKSFIYKFIASAILTPAGLKLDDVYATNLVKCTFPDNQEPRKISKSLKGKNDNERLRTFLFPFFQRCNRHFEQEIREVGPKIVISFGEVPHQLIWDEYDFRSQGVPNGMKEAFGRGYRVNLLGHDLAYFPCIRAKAVSHQTLQKHFPEFIQNLKIAGKRNGAKSTLLTNGEN